jgi:ATP-binding cassette subfamily G (WHITE) protein 2 (SNQ2)
LVVKNYGILVSFGIFFLICLVLFTEINTGVAGESSVILFKHGSKAELVKDAEAAVTSGDDEEKEKPRRPDSQEVMDIDEKAKEAMTDQPKMTNVFSWQHLRYTVNVGGERRVLLNDVSGYVAPGKLTALMGESGAGKVSGASLSFLCVLSY